MADILKPRGSDTVVPLKRQFQSISGFRCTSYTVDPSRTLRHFKEDPMCYLPDEWVAAAACEVHVMANEILHSIKASGRAPSNLTVRIYAPTKKVASEIEDKFRREGFLFSAVLGYVIPFPVEGALFIGESPPLTRAFPRAAADFSAV